MWRFGGAAPLVIGLSSLCVSILWCCCQETSRPPPEPRKISAASGGNTTLPCHASQDTVGAVKWMKESQYVYCNSDGHENKEKQDPWFAERVQLKAKDLTSGDLSIELMNLTTNASGTYHCSYKDTKGGSWINNSSIYLHVKDEQLNNNLSWTNAAIAVTVIVALFALIYPIKTLIITIGKDEGRRGDSKSDLDGQSSTCSKKRQHLDESSHHGSGPEEKELLSG